MIKVNSARELTFQSSRSGSQIAATAAEKNIFKKLQFPPALSTKLLGESIAFNGT